MKIVVWMHAKAQVLLHNVNTNTHTHAHLWIADIDVSTWRCGPGLRAWQGPTAPGLRGVVAGAAAQQQPDLETGIVELQRVWSCKEGTRNPRVFLFIQKMLENSWIWQLVMTTYFLFPRKENGQNVGWREGTSWDNQSCYPQSTAEKTRGRSIHIHRTCLRRNHHEQRRNRPHQQEGIKQQQNGKLASSWCYGGYGTPLPFQKRQPWGFRHCCVLSKLNSSLFLSLKTSFKFWGASTSRS